MYYLSGPRTTIRVPKAANTLHSTRTTGAAMTDEVEVPRIGSISRMFLTSKETLKNSVRAPVNGCLVQFMLLQVCIKCVECIACGSVIQKTSYRISGFRVMLKLHHT